MNNKFLLGSFLILFLALAISISGCANRNNQADTALSLTLDQKRACLQMTTFCENDPYTTFQYNFAKNIGDGALCPGRDALCSR